MMHSLCSIGLHVIKTILQNFCILIQKLATENYLSLSLLIEIINLFSYFTVSVQFQGMKSIQNFDAAIFFLAIHFFVTRIEPIPLLQIELISDIE